MKLIYEVINGNRYGHLVVLQKSNKINKHKKYLIDCLCDCGNTTSVYRNHLVNGSQKSCGCVHGVFCPINKKICSVCKTAKNLDEFSKKTKLKKGLRSECKNCINDNLTKRYQRYKSSAKNKKLDFQLSLNNFYELTSKKCYFCGNYTWNKNYCGIDRINSNIGYIFENCMPCCEIHNYMKNDMTKEQFIEECKKIIKFVENTI